MRSFSIRTSRISAVAPSVGMEQQRKKQAWLNHNCQLPFAAILLVLILSTVARGQASQTAIQIKSVDEVIENWKPDQHLFVKGDVGAADEQLNQLEAWLDENGPHWTVVLMHNARDERYVAPDGEKFFRLDAVEYALAHRLANQTEFGSLTHPQTGESSGAVFVLYLVERQFAYYSTDVYDRRSLGQSRWVGNLDREVIRAMRSGDRIIDAVKNTVKQIEGRLEKRIEKEVLDEQRAKDQIKRERQQYLGNLVSLITESETSMLPRIEEAARVVRTKYPDASKSELANPPIEKWRLELAGAKKASENPEFASANLRKSKPFREAKKQVTNIRADINRFLDSYAAHQSFEHMIYAVEARLDAIADHPTGVAAKSSVEAYELVDEARAGHARGELGFAGNILKAKELIKEGEKAIEAQQLKLKKEAERKQLVRRTLMIAAAVLGLAFLGLLWLMNIRRRPALRRAHALLTQESKKIEVELESVDAIVAESENIIGTPESFASKRFEGQTLLMGKTAHKQVENLGKMSTEARRVIDHCLELVNPSNPIAEAANMFTGARYEHCVNELNGKSVQVPGRVDENGLETESSWLTLDEFTTELHARKSLTSGNISAFGGSVAQVGTELEKLQNRIDDATDLDLKLAKASRLDRLFRIPSLMERILPATQSDFDKANAYADSDPVRAVSEIIPSGLQKIDVGLGVANAIHQARETSFAQLDDSANQLKRLGFDSRWIAERLDDLSDQADQVVADAVAGSVGRRAEEFQENITGLRQRAQRSLELGNEVSKEVEPRLNQLKQAIDAGRKSIASKLGISPARALAEDQYNPDVEVAQAAKQLQSARAALDYGGVESAMESLEVFKIEEETGQSLLESSLTSLKEFDSTYSAGVAKLEGLTKSLDLHRDIVESIKQKFADSASFLRDKEFVAGPWDDLQPEDDTPTIERVLTSCQEMLTNSRASMDGLEKAHGNGKILEAANSLHLVEADFGHVQLMFDEIAEHKTQLEQLVVSNVASLRVCSDRMGTLVSEVKDPRTQHATVLQYSGVGEMLENFQTLFVKSNIERDPFGDALAIADFNSRIDDLAAGLKVDRAAHDEATRAVVGAEAELIAVNRLVTQSSNDRIPDSRTIGNCQGEIAKLKRELEKVKGGLSEVHGQWKVVDSEASRVHSKLSVIGGRLTQELELAQQAADLMGEAADAVYEAVNWRGSYSIVVIGSPGADELENARRLLAAGNYVRSIEYSKAAKIAALNGIEKAKRQEKRHRQELARKAAQARKRRRSSSSGVTFLGSGNSSRSSSSFGFGSSRSHSSSSRSNRSSSSSSSSSSSRSSGFSRSSW